MIQRIFSNPFVIIIGVFSLLLIVVLMFFNAKGKTKKQSEKQETTKQTDFVEKPQMDERAKLVFKSKTDREKKLKNSKKVPKIQKVYDRVKTPHEEKKQVVDEPSISEDELLSKMQFVSKDKKVSKLVKSEQKYEKVEIFDNNEVDTDVNETSVKDELLKQKHGHFDKSRRLSRCIRDDNFDEMFSPHITDSYIVTNGNRHLNADNIETKLMERAHQTLANGGVTAAIGPVSQAEDQKRIEMATMFAYDEDDGEDIKNDIDEEFKINNVNARQLIIGNILMNRKHIKGNR
ncbi:MAG: hypothetical protein IJ538_04780 [Clostridia bacterium]|nr:hypothetical protein [Clostridia bacterium]